MAKNANGQPVVGIAVFTKVKKYARAYRSTILITKPFFASFLREIERVVVLSCEQAIAEEQPLSIAVAVPDKPVIDRLVTDQRIKAIVRDKMGNTANTPKQFLRDVNTYAAAVLVASIEYCEGVKLQDLVAGETVTKAVAKIPPKSKPISDPNDDTPAAKPKPLEPCLPREHWLVSYTLSVPTLGLEWSGEVPYFSAKTEDKIRNWLINSARRYCGMLGLVGHTTIEIVIHSVTKQQETA